MQKKSDKFVHMHLLLIMIERTHGNEVFVVMKFRGWPLTFLKTKGKQVLYTLLFTYQNRVHMIFFSHKLIKENHILNDRNKLRDDPPHYF